MSLECHCSDMEGHKKRKVMAKPPTTTSSKPRAKKPLPASLAALTLDDYDKFTLEHGLQGENAGDDPGEGARTDSMSATSVTVAGEDGEEVTYELAKLSSDHLRALCKQLKIKNMGSEPKNYMLERMADRLLYARKCATNSDSRLEKKRMLDFMDGVAEASKALVQQMTESNMQRKALVQQATESNMLRKESNMQRKTYDERAMAVDVLKMEFTYAREMGNNEEAAKAMERLKKIRSSVVP